MADGEKHISSTTLVIQPGGGTSSSVVTGSGSSSFSSSTQVSKSSSSSSQMSSSSTSSSSKTVKQTTTTSKTTKTAVTKSSASSFKSTSSKAISVKSNTSSFSDTFGRELGIDVDAEMKKLMSSADQEITSIRDKFFNLQPLALTGTGSDIIKLDSSSVNNYIDKAHNDRLKFNFDITEFESESISVKSDGNKIEVHAKKKSKKGDDETSEEYSRTYELPTSGSLNPESVTSSCFKDGILTVELPVNEALEGSK